tara:strand:+ start:246 stop:665 length:420 start_codon:yes stop_codon:yes gene_type:complete
MFDGYIRPWRLLTDRSRLKPTALTLGRQNTTRHEMVKFSTNFCANPLATLVQQLVRIARPGFKDTGTRSRRHQTQISTPFLSVGKSKILTAVLHDVCCYSEKRAKCLMTLPTLNAYLHMIIGSTSRRLENNSWNTLRGF